MGLLDNLLHSGCSKFLHHCGLGPGLRRHSEIIFHMDLAIRVKLSTCQICHMVLHQPYLLIPRIKDTGREQLQSFQCLWILLFLCRLFNGLFKRYFKNILYHYRVSDNDATYKLFIPGQAFRGYGRRIQHLFGVLTHGSMSYESGAHLFL